MEAHSKTINHVEWSANIVLPHWYCCLRSRDNNTNGGTLNSQRILMNNLLHLTKQQIQSMKVRFTIPSQGTDPIQIFKSDPEEINSRWFLWRNKPNVFNVGQTGICLVRIHADQWLFTTIKTITKDLGVHGGIGYEADELKQFSAYYGRVIVKFHKTFQNPAVFAQRVFDNLEVLEILPDFFDDDHFPGYDNVQISYAELKRILDRGLRDWQGALSNQKGVYLITDINNGKQYVGSATADKGMLLQRWSNYADNGHGGDTKLEELVQAKGFDYIKRYFQYTLLENYNSKVDDQIILQRESWWKNALMSRKFGYNGN